MSDPYPGPVQILDWLERLRTLDARLAERRSALDPTTRQREEAIRRRAARSAEELQAELDAELRRLGEFRQAAVAAIEARVQARIQRIRQAQRQLRKSAASRVEAEEGRRKFEIQREMLRATRQRDAGRADADARLTALTASLDAAGQERLVLESNAHALLGVYGAGVLRRLGTSPEPGDREMASPEELLIEELSSTLADLHRDLVAFRRRPLPRLSRGWPVILILVLTPLLAIPLLPYLRISWLSPALLGSMAAAVAALGVGLHFLGGRLARPAIDSLLTRFDRARTLEHAARVKSAESHRRTCLDLEEELARTTERSNAAWAEVQEWLETSGLDLPGRVDERAALILARCERGRSRALEAGARAHDEAVEHAKGVARKRQDEIEHEARRAIEFLAGERQGTMASLNSEWLREATPILQAIEAFQRKSSGQEFPSDPVPTERWEPPAQFRSRVRFAQLETDLPSQLRSLTDVPAGNARRPDRWTLPLLLQYPSAGSLLVEANTERRAQAIDILNQVICRLLAGSPPGRIALTLFDPVGLGQSFAGFTHLADEAGHVIHERVWTQAGQLETRLAELGEHLEKVIQMYLRDEYDTIAEYNEQAGNIAEKYEFLVLADFPAGFTDVALRRLLSLAASGARCGVHLLIHFDPRHTFSGDFSLTALRQACLSVDLNRPTPELAGRALPGTTVRLDPAPEASALMRFIQRVARANLDSNRVEVPFAQIAPSAAESWTLDTAAELRVAIGRTGATKLQYLAMGKGTRQHALIAGKTGSGKSTFFHVVITNLALWCRPDQVEFYLVDFKKGVEFKCYATHRLPHARVVAIESDREFGLSVLERLDDELRRRGDLFRAAEVQDLPAYRRTSGAKATPMPRVLLLVDEFQEFFVEEDRIARNASVLLDRIVRQGRAFGIHVILGSQTLGGAYTVARTTLGQMVVRIALQCNEADACLIMDEDNPAPRLLARPGEGIYNDDAGAKAGNSPFQVVWLPDDVRELHLRRVRQLADALPTPLAGPLVYEGDAPADVRENPILCQRLSDAAAGLAGPPRVWLGAPNSIKGPTEVEFARRNGDNLLVIGQLDDPMLALVGLSLVALAAQHPTAGARFCFLDGSSPDAPGRGFLERIVGAVPHGVTVGRTGDAAKLVGVMAAELRERSAAPPAADAPARFLIVHGLQQFRALRQEDDFGFGSSEGGPSAGAMFKELLSEGPAHGFHTLVTCDTYNNVSRFLGRKTLSEFALRVLFQMSANDSASLIDNPAAGRLGLHRALLYRDREGSIEVFRPYAQPPGDWIESVRRQLALALG